MRGIKSQAMVLAASSNDGTKVIKSVILSYQFLLPGIILKVMGRLQVVTVYSCSLFFSKNEYTVNYFSCFCFCVHE